MAGELITGPGQVEWSGLLLGRGTVYGLAGLTGWNDLPGVDGGDVPRPATHGTWAGRRYAQSRIVTARFLIMADDIDAAVEALEAATALSDDTTRSPLVIRVGGRTLLAYAAVDARALPVEPGYHEGRAVATIQWSCADPRRYALTERQAAVSIAAPTGAGLPYPLAYPLDYGADPATVNTAATLNAWQAASPPVVTITGPITRPRVTVTAGARVAVQEYDLILTASDTLVVDARAGTVLLNGVDRSYTATPVCGPLDLFRVYPGAGTVTLTAQSAAAGNSAVMVWRDATL